MLKLTNILRQVLAESIDSTLTKSFAAGLERKYNKLYPPPNTGTRADKDGISVTMWPGSDNMVELSAIYIPKQYRGQGIGGSIMSDIIHFADKHQLIITLTPSTDFGGSSISRLSKFYKQFGFVANKGRNKDFRTRNTMIRPLSKG